MKLLQKSLRVLAAAAVASLSAGFLAGCSDDTDYDNPSGETYIYSIAVSNGGFTGAENISGIIDEESHTISFTIPAETDIEAVKFSTKLSLGASLDKESYDVSSGSVVLLVTNNQNQSSYTAYFTMLEPTESPVLTAIVSRNDAGDECVGFVSDVTGTVYLNCDGSEYADIISVTTLPKRATYTLSNGVAGRVTAEDPGKLCMDFMGLTKEYDISFAGTPIFGADWSDVTVYNHSAGDGGMIWEDHSAENTRSTRFDGNILLIVSRQSGTDPKVLLYDEIKTGSPVSHSLDKTGIELGTFEVNAGSIQHSHIYVSNLTTGLSEDSPLKVYHWSNWEASCETVLTFAGNDEVKGRWGDNMSVCLDENGNGYIYFFDHTGGASAARFTVTDFNNVSQEPEVLTCPYSLAYYGNINPVPDETNVYTLTSSYQRAILLVDADLNLLNIIDTREDAEYPVTYEQDARIISYNGERYLITCSGQGWSYRYAQTLRVYDLSSGLNSILAFSNFNQGDRTMLYSFSLEGSSCSAWTANCGAGIGDDGSLRVMGAAPKAGFVVVEAHKKR